MLTSPRRVEPRLYSKIEASDALNDLVAQSLEARVDTVLFGGDNIDNRGHGEADLEAFLEGY